MAMEYGFAFDDHEEEFDDPYLTGVEFVREGQWRRELSRDSYGVVYEVMWRGTPCAAKKIHTLLLESVPGEQVHTITSEAGRGLHKLARKVHSILLLD